MSTRREHVAAAPRVHWSDVDGPLSWREWPGRGARTLVLVHALGGSSVSWAAVAPSLSRFGTVIALDLPGFGRSPRAGRAMTPARIQRVLSSFLAGRDPVVLVGDSFGGAVAALHASREPATVERLVLTSSYFPPVFEGLRPSVAFGAQLARHAPALMRAAAQQADPGSLPHLVREMAMHTPGPAALLREVAAFWGPEPEDRRRARTLAEGFGSLVAISVDAARTRRVFRSITCPVLVIHGENDPVVPVTWARAAAQRDWHVVALAETGHATTADPERWSATVGAWLPHG